MCSGAKNKSRVTQCGCSGFLRAGARTCSLMSLPRRVGHVAVEAGVDLDVHHVALLVGLGLRHQVGDEHVVVGVAVRLGGDAVTRAVTQVVHGEHSRHSLVGVDRLQLLPQVLGLLLGVLDPPTLGILPDPFVVEPQCCQSRTQLSHDSLLSSNGMPPGLHRRFLIAFLA